MAHRECDGFTAVSADGTTVICPDVNGQGGGKGRQWTLRSAGLLGHGTGRPRRALPDTRQHGRRREHPMGQRVRCRHARRVVHERAHRTARSRSPSSASLAADPHALRAASAEQWLRGRLDPLIAGEKQVDLSRARVPEAPTGVRAVRRRSGQSTAAQRELPDAGQAVLGLFFTLPRRPTGQGAGLSCLHRRRPHPRRRTRTDSPSPARW